LLVCMLRHKSTAPIVWRLGAVISENGTKTSPDSNALQNTLVQSPFTEKFLQVAQSFYR
jgi:hypothetical protein